MPVPWLTEQDDDKLVTSFRDYIGRRDVEMMEKRHQEALQRGLVDEHGAPVEGAEIPEPDYGWTEKEGLARPGWLHSPENFNRALDYYVRKAESRDQAVNNLQALKRAREKSIQSLMAARQESAEEIAEQQQTQRVALQRETSRGWLMTEGSFDPGFRTIGSFAVGARDTAYNFPGTGVLAKKVSDVAFGERHRAATTYEAHRLGEQEGWRYRLAHMGGVLVTYIAALGAPGTQGVAAKGLLGRAGLEGYKFATASALLADVDMAMQSLPPEERPEGWARLLFSLKERAKAGGLGFGVGAAGATALYPLNKALTRLATASIPRIGTLPRGFRPWAADRLRSAAMVAGEGGTFTGLGLAEHFAHGGSWDQFGRAGMTPGETLAENFLNNTIMFGLMRAGRGFMPSGLRARQERLMRRRALQKHFLEMPPQRLTLTREMALKQGMDPFEVEVAYRLALAGYDIPPDTAIALAKNPNLLLEWLHKSGNIPPEFRPAPEVQAREAPAREAAQQEIETYQEGFYGGEQLHTEVMPGVATHEASFLPGGAHITRSLGRAREAAERHRGENRGVHQVEFPRELSLAKGYEPVPKELKPDLAEAIRFLGAEPLYTDVKSGTPLPLADVLRIAAETARNAGVDPQMQQTFAELVGRALQKHGYDGVSHVGGKPISSDIWLADASRVKLGPFEPLEPLLPKGPKGPKEPPEEEVPKPEPPMTDPTIAQVARSLGEAGAKVTLDPHEPTVLTVGRPGGDLFHVERVGDRLVWDYEVGMGTRGSGEARTPAELMRAYQTFTEEARGREYRPEAPKEPELFQTEAQGGLFDRPTGEVRSARQGPEAPPEAIQRVLSSMERAKEAGDSPAARRLVEKELQRLTPEEWALFQREYPEAKAQAAQDAYQEASRLDAERGYAEEFGGRVSPGLEEAIFTEQPKFSLDAIAGVIGWKSKLPKNVRPGEATPAQIRKAKLAALEEDGISSDWVAKEGEITRGLDEFGQFETRTGNVEDQVVAALANLSIQTSGAWVKPKPGQRKGYRRKGRLVKISRAALERRKKAMENKIAAEEAEAEQRFAVDMEADPPVNALRRMWELFLEVQRWEAEGKPDAGRPDQIVLDAYRARDALARMAPEGSQIDQMLLDPQRIAEGYQRLIESETTIRPEQRFGDDPDLEFNFSGPGMPNLIRAFRSVFHKMLGWDASTGGTFRPGRQFYERPDGVPYSNPSVWKFDPFRSIERQVVGRLPAEMGTELVRRMSDAHMAFEFGRDTDIAATKVMFERWVDWYYSQPMHERPAAVERLLRLKAREGTVDSSLHPEEQAFHTFMQAFVNRKTRGEAGLHKKKGDPAFWQQLSDPTMGGLLADRVVAYMFEAANMGRWAEARTVPADLRDDVRIGEFVSKNGPDQVVHMMFPLFDAYISAVNKRRAYHPLRKWWLGALETDAGRRMSKKAQEWFTTEIDIAAGSLSKTEAALQTAYRRVADYLYAKNPKRFGWLKRSEEGGGSLMRGWVYLNYLGAMGLNPGTPIRNSTQHISTVAELAQKEKGPAWARGLAAWGRWRRAATKFFVRNSKGKLVLNPKLHEWGFLDHSLMHTIRDLGNKTIRSMLPKEYWMGRGRDIGDALLVMFKYSEWANRGIAGLAAYDQARDRGHGHDKAVHYARQVIRRTQFDYRRGMGGRAYAGPVGHWLFQFGRFPNYQLDFIHSLVQKGMYGDWDELGYHDRSWAPFITYVVSGQVLFQALRGILGVELPEVEAPAASIGELPKHVLSAPVKAIAGAIGGWDAEEGAREALSMLGLEPWQEDTLESLIDQTGPGAQQGMSLGAVVDAYLGSTNAVKRRKAKQQFLRAFPTFIPGGVQMRRTARLVQELRDGKTRSRFRGAPQYEVGTGDAWARWMGMTTEQVQQQMEEENSLMRLDMRLSAEVSEINKNARLAMQEAETPEDWRAVYDEFYAAYEQLEDEYPVVYYPDEVSRRFGDVAREFRAREGRTKIEDILHGNKALRRGYEKEKAR